MKLTGTVSNKQPGVFKNTGYLKVDINYPIILIADTVNEYLNYICFYDADKNFISGLSNTETTRTINTIAPENIPETTRYVNVCDKTANVDSFVSYHPFTEQNMNRFVDSPKGNNIYCQIYNSYNADSLDNTTRYNMPVFIKRNRNYNTFTISGRLGYNIYIYFYDRDNVLISSVTDKSQGRVEIPNTCEYIGFDDFGAEIKQGKTMINWGNETLEYEPYDSFFMQSFVNKDYLNTYTKKAGVQFPFKKKGFVNKNGVINTTQDTEIYRYTDYIKIDRESYIMFLGDSSNQYVNVISYYDYNKKYISGISNIDTVGNEILHIISSQDIPEETRYIICTAKVSQVDNNSAYFLCTPYMDTHTDINFFKNRYLHKESESLTTGSLVINNVPNVKYNQTISLNARLTSIGKITLSHGKRTYAAGMVEIDSNNIYTYTLAPELSETIPHGLTFNKFIECIIRQNDEATATVIIRTLGGEFKRDNIPFLGCRDDVMLEAANSNLSDIKLSYTCSDFGKEIWSFGDSYFEKIPAKLKELGYNNSLFDAFSGRTSLQSISSLKYMIGIVGVPQLIYWPMGMNDPDTEDAVNTDWETALNELQNICNYYNVELVLATIPNVPERNHNYKNDIVKNSGYRYVDINEAVGADIDPNWYDGLLSSDKVHPTLNGGDYVIAMAVINAIPELKVE